MTTERIAGVFYTDGGARPNPGNAGWGLHGYLYDIDVEVKNPGKHDAPTDKGYIPTWTDIKQGKPVRIKNYVDGFGAIKNQTNNYAELIGFKRLLEFIIEHKFFSVLVFLDSSYVLNGITEHYPQWKINNWKTSAGKEPMNLPLWHEIDRLFNEAQQNTKIDLKWCKGHIGERGNTRADELATCGVYTAYNDREHDAIEILPVSGYLNPKVEFNNLFTKNRWYFLSGADEPDQLDDGRYLYFTGYHGKKTSKKDDGDPTDEEDMEEDEDYTVPDSLNWGVTQPDTYFGLVVTKEKDPLISMLQRVHNTRTPCDYGTLSLGKLTTILNAKVYDMLMKYKDMFLVSHSSRFAEISLPDKSVVTWEIKPQRRAYTATETFGELKGLLGKYLANQLETTEVTDHFYETKIEGKKKIKTTHRVREDIPKSLRFFDIDVNVKLADGTIKVQRLRTTHNIDFPVRAHMQRLTEGGTVKPTVKIVTWLESKEVFRYAVVIERNGELLFWSATDCNVRLIR